MSWKCRFCLLRALAAVAILLTSVSARAQSAGLSSTPAVAAWQRLPGNPAPRGSGITDHGPAPDSLALTHILLMLHRSPDREQAMNSFISRQYDPRSGDFHKWLTPQQFGEQFGPSAADIARVTQWLTLQGFTVNRVPLGGLFVDFSGDAGKVGHAFRTEIHHYTIRGEDHYANAGDPSIPAELAPLVTGFRALNDLHPRSLVRNLGVARLDRSTGAWSRASPLQAHLTNPPGSNSPLYIAGPQDLATIYGINQVWREHTRADPSSPLVVGTGQTIGVVGETQLQSADIQTFRDQFGITALGPNGSVQMENPPASVCAAPDPNNNEPEGYLDAEWSGATAPDATIDFVACGRQGLTSGTDLAAAYVVADPAHAQKISVLSTSYSDCEAEPQSEANQFYVSLWQQAAVEGITVVVAAGDTGGDGCVGVYTHATDGLSVLNAASTPWNIAAGGTDFSDVFSANAAAYWSPVNGANFKSALSYIPEMVWNDSCASPLVLQKFGSTFSGAAGADGFCTYASQQPSDPNTGFPPYFFATAGGGGLSAVSARPDWQAGVPGIPAAGGRALPDIAMFASSGNTWSQTLILCDSALVNLAPGTGCDFNNADDVFAGYGGGTSFVAPAFAGIMALIDQKSGDRQGQANYVLYPLAASQYATQPSTTQPSATQPSATQPSLDTCAAYLGTQVLSSCYFHDVSGTPNPSSSSSPLLAGNTAIPCTGTATSVGTFTDQSTDPSSNSENCTGYEITVADSGSTLTTTPDYYGELSTADDASQPAFAAGPGYDLATGLGSPNVFALVNAPQWSALAITNTTLPPGRADVPYAQTLAATGRVQPYHWTIAAGSLPAGLSLSPSTGAIAGTPTMAGTSTFTVQVADTESPSATATATFPLTIAPALLPTATVLSASTLSAGTGSSVTLSATVSGSGSIPSGTVTFYNGANSIGTVSLTGGQAILAISFPVPGASNLRADYSGDTLFAASQSNLLTITIVVPGFVATVSPGTLTLMRAGAGVVVNQLTPQGGFTGPVSLSCGALPRYFSCIFATATVMFAATGEPMADRLAIASAVTPAVADRAAIPMAAMLAVVMLWLPAGIGSVGKSGRKRWPGSELRKNLHLLVLCCCSLVMLVGMSACGGHGSQQAPAGTYTVPILFEAQGLPTQTLNVTVTVQ